MPDSYLADSGALVVRSGAKTGRWPKDKRVVAEPGSEDNVWWGRVNIKMTEPAFMINRERAIDYLNTRKSVYVIDGYAGWDPAYRVRVRVVCALAYHALFMRNMLVMPEELPEDEREGSSTVHLRPPSKNCANIARRIARAGAPVGGEAAGVEDREVGDEVRRLLRRRLHQHVAHEERVVRARRHHTDRDPVLGVPPSVPARRAGGSVRELRARDRTNLRGAAHASTTKRRSRVLR